MKPVSVGDYSYWHSHPINVDEYAMVPVTRAMIDIELFSFRVIHGREGINEAIYKCTR